MSKQSFSFPLFAKDLPTPPDYKDLVFSRLATTRNKREREKAFELLALRIHFHGMQVACVYTQQGLKVLMAGYAGTGVLRDAINKHEETSELEVYIKSPEQIDELLEATVMATKTA